MFDDGMQIEREHEEKLREQEREEREAAPERLKAAVDRIAVLETALKDAMEHSKATQRALKYCHDDKEVMQNEIDVLKGALKDARAENKRIKTQAENYNYAWKQEKIASEKWKVGLREALETIQRATTLPPDALNESNAEFYRIELQRCIGTAARALLSFKEPAGGG